MTGFEPVVQAAGISAAAARSNGPFCGWTSQGACQDEDPELFFPIAATGPAGRHQISAQKRVCQRCTVRASCLTYALETRQSGIWGGTTLEERFAMAGPSRCHSGEQSSRTVCARTPEYAVRPADLIPGARLALIGKPSILTPADARGQLAAEARQTAGPGDAATGTVTRQRSDNTAKQI